LLIALFQRLGVDADEQERRLLKTIAAGEARTLQRLRVQEAAAALADTIAYDRAGSTVETQPFRQDKKSFVHIRLGLLSLTSAHSV
jgi:hypothetical protein